MNGCGSWLLQTTRKGFQWRLFDFPSFRVMQRVGERRISVHPKLYTKDILTPCATVKQLCNHLALCPWTQRFRTYPSTHDLTTRSRYWSRYFSSKSAFPMTVYSSPNAPKGWQSEQQWQRLRSAETLYTAAHCTTLQHTATHCNALQHTATHYNTLQHTAVTRVYWDTCDGHKEVLGSYYALTWLQ